MAEDIKQAIKDAVRALQVATEPKKGSVNGNKDSNQSKPQTSQTSIQK